MSDDPIFGNNAELAAQLISSGAKQMVDQARALGLTWTLRLATIGNSLPDSFTATFDGDTRPIPVTNMSGLDLEPGERVYCLIVPPSGNFVLSPAAVRNIRLGANCNNVGSMASGTTVSGTFVSQPGSPSVPLTKKYDDTGLRFSWAQTYYTQGGDVNALFGAVTAAGNQTFLGKNFIATTSGFRTPISGVAAASGVPAGTQTWVGTWAQAGGGGTLTTDSGCFWSMCIEEYWPTE